MNTFQAVILHGELIEERFKVPKNIRVISYNCPETLYHSSAPIFHAFRSGAGNLKQILNEFSFYTDSFLDFAVHEPGSYMNNINVLYDITDQTWKLGYLVPSGRAKKYVATTVKTEQRIRAQSYAEAQKAIRGGTLCGGELKAYSSGYSENVTFLLDLQQSHQQLKGVLQRISTITKLFCKCKDTLNIVVWTCKTPSLQNHQFLYGKSLPKLLSVSAPKRSSLSNPNIMGDVERWEQSHVGAARIQYILNQRNAFEPVVRIVVTRGGKSESGMVRRMILRAIDFFLDRINPTSNELYLLCAVVIEGRTMKTHLGLFKSMGFIPSDFFKQKGFITLLYQAERCLTPTKRRIRK